MDTIGANTHRMAGWSEVFGAALVLGIGVACGSPSPTVSVPATQQLIASADPHSSGQLDFRGQVNRRSGTVEVPLAFTPVELVQNGRVVASAKCDHAGQFHLVGIIHNGNVEIRLPQAPDVRVVLEARWQQMHINDIKLVAPE
jgi:hypothetical protein